MSPLLHSHCTKQCHLPPTGNVIATGCNADCAAHSHLFCLTAVQVRETSRSSLWKPSSLLSSVKSNEQVKKDFSDIILPSQLHNNVRSLAAMAANTKRHGAPFRHMLFYGKRHDLVCWCLTQLPFCVLLPSD